jgi:hypothetical protein
LNKPADSGDKLKNVTSNAASEQMFVTDVSFAF